MSKQVSIKGHGLAVNSAWNFAGSGFALLVGLITVPIYLHALGIERFGILAILQALIAPIAILNAGVTSSTVKYVASYVGNGKIDQARQAIAGALLVNFAVGLFGALVFFFGAPYFLRVGFEISPDLLSDAENALRIMGAVWFVAQIRANFRGVLEGLQDQRRVAVGDALKTITTAVFCSAAVLATGKLSWFVFAQFISLSVSMLVFWWQSSKEMDGFGITRKSAFAGVNDVFSYSAWSVVNSAIATIANVADKYVIGIAISVSSLGAYSVAQRLQDISRILFYAVKNALFPAASAVVHIEGSAERLVVRTAWSVSFFAGILLAVIAVCGPSFLRIWVGDEVANIVSLPLRILILKLIFEIPSVFIASYLAATKRIRLIAANNAFTTVLTLSLLIPLAMEYGLTGVSVSLFLGMLLTRLPFHAWAYRQFFRSYFTAGEYFTSLYGIGFVCFIAGVGVSALVDLTLFDLHPWVRLIVTAVSSVVAIAVFTTVSVALIYSDFPRLKNDFLAIFSKFPGARK